MKTKKEELLEKYLEAGKAAEEALEAREEAWKAWRECEDEK